MRKTYIFGPHKIELTYGSTGTSSPWHLEAYQKYNIVTWGTADVAYYIRVDEKDIYKIKYMGNLTDICNKLESISAHYDECAPEMEESLGELISNSGWFEKCLSIEDSLKAHGVDLTE